MKNFDHDLHRLYSATRLIIAFIWFWSGLISWFVFPEAESLTWLRKVGLTNHTELWFISSCLMDLAMGVLAIFFASKLLWRFQMALILFYSIAIAIALPEFLIHPFAPVIKNLAILACLYFLLTFEDHRNR